MGRGHGDDRGRHGSARLLQGSASSVTRTQLRYVPDGGASVEKDGVTIATGDIAIGLDDDRPEVVMPGQVIQVGVSLTRWPGPVHADEPLRLYAVALPNRRIWGPAAPILRALLNGGWNPVDAPPEALTPLPGAPFRPKAVEPRWKLWTHKELRKPSLPPPHVWPLPDPPSESEVDPLG